MLQNASKWVKPFLGTINPFLGKVSGPLGGATEKTLIWRNFTNFKDMKTIESALESWNIIFFKIEKIFWFLTPFCNPKRYL